MSKAKTADVKVLKGQEAEDKVLEYVKMMNRPYGAVDVSANLKGAVAKANTQKILVALSEKGELTQKTYGKTTFFVANQSKIDAMPTEECAKIETELKAIEENNKALTAEVKALHQELAKAQSTPTDELLETKIKEAEEQIKDLNGRLKPLKAGSALISAEEVSVIESEWIKWRAEWVRRKKVFKDFWALVIDAMTNSEAENLQEELGIELDTPERDNLEHNALCQPKPSGGLKRKRGS